MDKTIKTLTEVLQESKKEGTSPYDTTAEVVRIEGNTAWVHIPGGIDETPVSMTIDARVGDIVQVRVSGGRAWITGNASAPPTDDTVAKVAENKAVAAETLAENAEQTANTAHNIAQAAQVIAANTNQYFWFQETGLDTGAHITEVPQSDFTDPASPDYQSGGNLLARSNGLALRDGMIELATLQQSGMDVNTDDGNGNLVNIAHLGYGPGKDSGGGTSDAPYYTLGKRASGSTIGNYSVAEGFNNFASGTYAHAEGHATSATEVYSHAEGWGSVATGEAAHAEGSNAAARGYCSHAEGFNTNASGSLSHAQNEGTIAQRRSQTAIGEYNVADTSGADGTVRGDYAVIVGNGTADNARSNALTVDWSGNVEASGDITDGTNNVLSNKVNNQLTTPTATITASTGTLVSTEIRQFGKVVFMRVAVRNSSAVASGSNIFVGSLSQTALRPIINCSGAGYYGSTPTLGSITTTGSITIRNCSPASVTISGANSTAVTFTYFVS